MNQLNYASLEASKRLVDAGIVLETEFVWYQYNPNTLTSLRDAGKEIPQPYLIDKLASLPISHLEGQRSYIPCPSMAEVWRELPEGINRADLDVWKAGGLTNATYLDDKINLSRFVSRDTNPTDALIDLLIWCRKEKS